MAVLVSDNEQPVFSPEELSAYEEGRQARRDGKDFCDCPYRYKARGPENAAYFAWLLGREDAEAGVSLAERVEAERNGAKM